MITAVDTNILINIVAGGAREAGLARSAMKHAGDAGALVLPVVCYAELSAQFANKSSLDDFLRFSSFYVLPLDETAAYLAESFYKAYRFRGGSRKRMLADFLIGAQAQAHTDRLLTNDARFFGDTFPNLVAVNAADLA